MAVGRFAPSPTASLHLGNLRTALLAWLFARSADSEFRLRFEDLDGAVRPEHYDSQIQDLTAIGVDWDGPVVRQTDRLDAYQTALHDLIERDLTYECYCSRREIREATQAPNGMSTTPTGAYPGTCRSLTAAERATRLAAGRPPALRVRGGERRSFIDDVCGSTDVVLDDFVIRRNDGMPAYNLVVVIDDHLQGVRQVVRADDLLESTARQLLVHDLFGLEPPTYAHVPLVLAPNGKRLAKRDGATTLDDRLAMGERVEDVVQWLLDSALVGTAECALDELAVAWSPTDLIDALVREPTTLSAAELTHSPER